MKKILLMAALLSLPSVAANATSTMIIKGAVDVAPNAQVESLAREIVEVWNTPSFHDLVDPKAQACIDTDMKEILYPDVQSKYAGEKVAIIQFSKLPDDYVGFAESFPGIKGYMTYTSNPQYFVTLEVGEDVALSPRHVVSASTLPVELIKTEDGYKVAGFCPIEEKKAAFIAARREKAAKTAAYKAKASEAIGAMPDDLRVRLTAMLADPMQTMKAADAYMVATGTEDKRLARMVINALEDSLVKK